MRDQSARMEKSGEGLSIADKEAILEDAEPEKTDAEATTDGASGDPIRGMDASRCCHCVVFRCDVR